MTTIIVLMIKNKNKTLNHSNNKVKDVKRLGKFKHMKGKIIYL